MELREIMWVTEDDRSGIKTEVGGYKLHILEIDDPKKGIFHEWRVVLDDENIAVGKTRYISLARRLAESILKTHISYTYEGRG